MAMAHQFKPLCSWGPIIDKVHVNVCRPQTLFLSPDAMLSLLRWCACWATLLLLPGVWPALHISDLPGAESDEAGLEPFGWSLGGFDKLVPFVLPSPNQEGAGSCLYMATTGVAEWWLARLNPTLSRAPDGPLDLSERHLMNLAGGRGNEQEDKADLPNWRTDSIYLFNQVLVLGGAAA